MFRWCTACRHLIGEAEPLDDYAFVYELCGSCARAGAEPSAPRAGELLSRLAQLCEAGARSRCEPFVAEALRAGLSPTDVMLGLVQPTLYDVGRRWERGELRVSDEHRVTALCLRVMELLPPEDEPRPPAGGPDVLLAPVNGNDHYLGVRLLGRLAHDEGCRCLAVYPGVPDEEIAELAWHRKSALVGLSVAMPDAIPAAARLARRLRRELPGARVVLGGHAFRRSPRPAPPEDAPVLLTLDDFRAALADLRRAAGARP